MPHTTECHQIGRNFFDQGQSRENLEAIFVADGEISDLILDGWKAAKLDHEQCCKDALAMAMQKSEPENMQDVLEMIIAGEALGKDCPWYFTVYAWRPDASEEHKGNRDWASYNLGVKTVYGKQCFHVNNGGWDFYLDDDLNAVMYHNDQIISDTKDWTWEVVRTDKEDLFAGMTEEQRAMWDDDVAF